MSLPHQKMCPRMTLEQLLRRRQPGIKLHHLLSFILEPRTWGVYDRAGSEEGGEGCILREKYSQQAYNHYSDDPENINNTVRESKLCSSMPRPMPMDKDPHSTIQYYF